MTLASPLHILVDFDNLDPSIKSSPLHSIAGMILQRVQPQILAASSKVQVRLYGGWYGATYMTRSAQALAPQISSDFPRPHGYTGSAGKIDQLIVHLELAVGPIHLPSVVFYETLAQNRPVRNFRWISQTFTGCLNPHSCGLTPITVANGCPIATCNIKLKPLMVCDEQKIVDTLLVTDLIYLSTLTAASHVVVVSSDTDMWPGILLAAAYGCKVVHVHTRSGWTTQNRLTRTLGTAASHYSQTSL